MSGKFCNTPPTPGINEDGVTGAVTGLAKGLIGTVAKPAAGLLDFASGTTLAITQSTRSSESIGKLEISFRVILLSLVEFLSQGLRRSKGLNFCFHVFNT